MVPFLSERLQSHWFFRYKLYHFLFWAVYHFLIGATEFSLADMMYMIFQTQRYLLYLFYVIIHTFAVFGTIYILVPQFLEKGKLFKFILSLCLWIVTTSLIIMVSIFFASFLTGKELDYFCAFSIGTSPLGIARSVATQILPHSAGAILVGLSIKLVNNWSQTQQKQQELEKDKLETELKFLRNQFNPHFLFNTINSIFFLIHKDPGMASNALGKFSELLRYQLYECNEQRIPLSSEIEYLKNFVSLEKLRRNPDFKVEIDIEDTFTGHLGISPFILMTFVENAFKHVSQHKNEPNWITIKLSVKSNQTLQFEVINSTSLYHVSSLEVIHYGGIGLKNVQRRLELIYPEDHELEIEEGEKQFAIKLRLKLTEFHEAPQRVFPQEALVKI